MRRPLLAIATAVVLASAIPCVAHSNDSNSLPGDQPLIYGKVTRITSHTVVILTRDGESMPMEFDSRTVMSTDLPSGCSVRVEFRLLESGRYLAQRVTPLDRNSSAWSALTRRIARRTGAVSPASYSGGGSTQAPESSTTPDETASNSSVSSTEGAEGADASVASASGPETEKQASTASAVPVILVVALLMLGGTLLLKRFRRRMS